MNNIAQVASGGVANFAYVTEGVALRVNAIQSINKYVVVIYQQTVLSGYITDELLNPLNTESANRLITENA